MKKLSFALTSTFVLSTAAFAEKQAEETIVTGELRDANVLTIANSVSVIDEELIKQRNALNLEDVLNLAPNVNFSTGASRGRFIQIRGIGERSQFTSPINPSVGIIVDGIDFTGLGTGVTALDTQQLEVFRGPQGTLYGANALAGLINVVGNAPTEELYGEVKFGAGNYNAYDASGVISAPISEAVGWRFAAMKNVSDGYIENEFLDTEDTNNIDEFSARNHIHFQAGEDLSIDLISYFIDIDNGYDAFSLDNNRTTLSDQPGQDRQETFANALHLNYEGMSLADLNATLSAANSEIDYGYDEDWSFREICAIDSDCAFWQYSTFDRYERDNDNQSLDLQLVSKDAEAAISWAAGIYYRNQDVDLTRSYTNNDPEGDFYNPISNPETSLYTSEFSTQNTALYGQLTIALSDSLALVTGARIEDYSADFQDSNAASFEPAEDLWGGKLALEYTDGNDTLWYALVSRGYKVGGFNPDPSIEDDVKQFDTETMLNYELGMKGSWLDESLTTQVALFYQQRDDVQVNQSRAFPNEGVFEFVGFIDNAASGNNYGAEVEFNWQLTELVTLFGSLGLLETEYQDWVNLSHVDRNEDTGEGYDMSGRAQAHAPEYQYFAGSQFDLGEALYFRIEFEGKDSFYFSESHNETSQSYNLINARIGYDIGNASFSVWGKNLGDEEVETRGFYFSNAFGNDPRKFYAPEPYTQKGAPLTFGITASYTFL